MKSFIKMTLISSAIVLALAGCDDKKTTEENKTPATTTTNATETAPAPAENKAEPAKTDDKADSLNNKIKITTEAQKESYALGSSFANYLKSNLEQNEVKADQEYLISGFNETMKGNSQLNQEEVKTILEAFGKRIQEESQARFEKQKTENTAAGEKFREAFAKEPGVIKTKSGLLYKVIQEGTGAHPTANDTVIVHYVGTLTDGRKFDSSYDRNEPATFPLNGVIKGWTEGIQLIGVGGKIKLVVPPELAYEDKSLPSQGNNANITPASTLVFEVELLGIDKDNNEEAIPTAQPVQAPN
ncbi:MULTISPECIES: FKBP-type peptidyl-prolyl cis-trans isomerase [unclassified Gilliamella]|uniref:FKBP-type peptidyl-prolyl cis-trans isomerase n=1 Tax=unclassified Gilliamella TaxID=2685620 RepID=UPI00226A393A|nr:MULTISPECIES: FKBP-type peptidyl-prolyl cis-trans isomerase [unclassified Gilliamella]MCX8597495.1 FKBP-type peptidyl-prolyl cis-trans isomerase [Gilliamella sp. B3493]MCX8599722.1 FKBP-type peptidyl-prolyl cis-trans isomerase [Gilliamella sp. B3486]MCX8689997.1 FKBP-type peptidyl-prolyl cis-trans isomerase [Gilliamella sp. B2973]MCX8705786.1 FKBP-type peptidyl-prolyl cis-trans isomerase [Gilliamella sp. B3127]